MAFDFQNAVSTAKKVVEAQESNGNQSVSYAYPLVYPQKGHNIVVRPLFNPASGQIVRLVNRHEKVACYRTYGIDCPICKVQQQVKDMTGQDPFGRGGKSKSRGICFAQYISSTNQIDKGNNQGILQPGEIILFMFPWSVYSQINAIIQGVAQTPTGMDQAFSHAQQGLFLQVTVSPDFKYTTINVPYMTFQTPQTDDDFMKMLEGMQNLNDQVLPSTITEDVDKQVKEYADAIYRQYVAPRVPNQTQQVPQPVSYPTQPTPQPTSQPITQPTYTPSSAVPYSNVQSINQGPAQTATGSKPACYGKHENGAAKCICCPCEVECMDPSSSDMPF